MFFESPGKSTRASTRANKKEDENKIKSVFIPSQGGQLKLCKSKELIAGTEEIDDDDDVQIVEVKPPQPKPKSVPVASIFSRVKKQKSPENNFDFGDENVNDSMHLKRTLGSSSLNLKKSNQANLSTSSSRQQLSKRPAIEISDSDDDFFSQDPKKSKTVVETKKETTNKATTTITKQLQKTSIFNLKRIAEQPVDNSFDLPTKKAKKTDEIKLRRNNRDVVDKPSAPVPITSAITSKIHNKSGDLNPGREIASTQWLSKDSLNVVKKEQADEEMSENSQIDSVSESSARSIFNVVRTSSNLSDTSEVGGGRKAFKKKKNFKSQSNVMGNRFVDLKDAEVLYAPTDI